jgi:hypothetical protein
VPCLISKINWFGSFQFLLLRLFSAHDRKASQGERHGLQSRLMTRALRHILHQGNTLTVTNPAGSRSPNPIPARGQ